MKYYIEVLVFDMRRTNPEPTEWVKLSPKGVKPYEFDTREEAWKTARMCYPEHLDRVRIVSADVTT